MVTGTVIFHIVMLAYMVELLRKLDLQVVRMRELAKVILLLIFTGLFVLLIHIVEIWIWAMVFLYLDAVPDLESAIYFSTVTSTTVGYGDLVLDHGYRLFGSFEAMSGILNFGISTAFILAVLRSSFTEFFEFERKHHKTS